MSNSGRNILITGATGTIGRAIAEAIATPGSGIAIHCNTGFERAEELARQLCEKGSNAFVLKADLSRAADAAILVDEAIKKLGELTILIHAAAVFDRTPFGTISEEQWDRILDIDLKAAFFLAQSAANVMQKNGGKMIFFSDVAAKKPYGGYLPYCIAKAGIDALVKGLAKTLAPKIQVVGIAPYIVSRPPGMSDQSWNDLISKTPMRRPSTPEEIAAIVKMLIESDGSITGQIIAVDGGRLLR